MKRIGSIYKITNIKNKKVYIGQTVQEPRIRFRRHLSDSRRDKPKSPLHRSIQKNGVDFFTFQVIEQVDEDVLDSREIHYIKEFQSTNPEKGYNLTLGGEGAMTRNKLTPLEVSLLIEDLRDTLMDFSSLAAKYKVSESVIHSVNSGRSYFFGDLTYPIRSRIMTANLRFTEEQEYRELVKDLNNLSLGFNDISKKYGVSETTISKVNQGESIYKERYHSKDTEPAFPIRMGATMTRETYNKIVKDLRDGDQTINELFKKYGVSRQTMSGINNGKVFKMDDITYPIRKRR